METPNPTLLEVFDPASGRVSRHVQQSNPSDVDMAVRAASDAFSSWSNTPALRRARVLQEFLRLLKTNQDYLARVVSDEHGKTIEDAHGSVQRGLEVVEFACGIPHLLKGEFAENVGTNIDCYSLRQAVGVCVGITPFNFPVMVPLWMFPVAIACGNTFVLKPSERVPSASVILAELLKEAGLPKGVFNVVHGGAITANALLEHPLVDAVSFVGSTSLAKHVYETAARTGKRVQALGGAKNHAIVMPDADLEYAADAISGAAYGSAGERCMAISAVVAVAEAAEPLIQLLKDKAVAIRVGPSAVAGSDMGPLITAAHRSKVSSYVDQGVAEGAKLVVDGREISVEKNENGFFFGPTLFDEVTPEMRIYKEEIFGPVLSVLRTKRLEDALGLVNSNPYGNGAAIFTASGGAARAFEHRVRAGMVGINVPIPVPMAFFSFGGWKQSLFGDSNIHGTEGIRFYTRLKTVSRRWPEGKTVSGYSMPTLG